MPPSPPDHDQHEASFFRRFFRRFPKQPRSRALVDAILDASEELLSDDEHANLASKESSKTVNVERLAERAGVSPGSFYEYFASEEGLVGALLGRATARTFDDFMATIAAELALPGSPEATLERAVRATARTVSTRYLERPKTTRAVLRVALRLGLLPMLQDDRDRFAREMARRCAELVPTAPKDAVEATMRDVADIVMGMVFADLFRKEQDASGVAVRAGDAAWALVRDRLRADFAA